jgi:hypothetical protein
MSETQKLLQMACTDAELYGNAEWPVVSDTPNPFSEEAYMGTMQELLNDYETVAMVALEICNGHDRDSCHAPRVLLFDLIRHCWMHRVPMAKALPICSLFLLRCRKTFPANQQS